MLTSKDIDKLLSVLATKQDIQKLDERLTRVEDTLGRVLTALDRLAKAFEDLHAEYAAVKVQLSRHEKWIRQIAKQAGVKLEA